jgi:hypothetical protein
MSFMDNISGKIYSEGITILWIVFMQYFNPKDTKLHWNAACLAERKQITIL